MTDETVPISMEECPNCHVLFWISKVHRDRLRDNKETFYCPSGHPQSYTGKSDTQLLKEKKEELFVVQQDLDSEIDKNAKLQKEIKKKQKKKQVKK